MGGEKGFGLVEVMISLVVVLLVSLAMMQTALMSIDSNMINVLRDEAVSIAAERMNEAKNTLNPGSDPGIIAVTLNACGNPPIGDANYQVSVTRDVRNIPGFRYGTRRTVTVTSGVSQITILVRWEYKGQCYTHSITSLVQS